MSELLALGPSPPASTSTAVPAMPAVAGMHAKLVKADFHGSLVTGILFIIKTGTDKLAYLPCIVSTVKQSKNPCLVGLSGIVIHETENAFKVVTKKDKLKRLFIPASSLNLVTNSSTMKQCFQSKIAFLHSQSQCALLFHHLYW
jgi:ribonuclease P protein subunit POP4